MKIEVYEKGSKVKVQSPGKGERGIWLVVGILVNSGWDDPAYDVVNERSGKSRIFRHSRLKGA